jgi:phytoene synthase
MDLIFGMRMDLERSRYADFRELSTYCYHVAGVVGLMMSYILGVSAERAYLHACHLGMAMQLTNICRDIREDWRLGRIYLPMNWLRDAHIDTDRADWLDREIELMSVVRRMLGEAEHLYRSGDRGLRFLSFRSRLAILAARLVYSEIGRQLLRRGPAGLRSRVVTSPFRKAALLSKSVFKNVLSLAWLRPWRRSTPREVFLYVPESF